jgi:head-tail adaptor
MEAGRLRHRVDIQHRATVQNVHGEEEALWTNWATAVPAEILSISAREFVAGQGVVSQVTDKIRIRWRPGLVPTMRIRHLIDAGSPQVHDIYNIKGILPDETNRVYVWIPCTKGVNEG